MNFKDVSKDAGHAFSDATYALWVLLTLIPCRGIIQAFIRSVLKSHPSDSAWHDDDEVDDDERQAEKFYPKDGRWNDEEEK